MNYKPGKPYSCASPSFIVSLKSIVIFWLILVCTVSLEKKCIVESLTTQTTTTTTTTRRAWFRKTAAAIVVTTTTTSTTIATRPQSAAAKTTTAPSETTIKIKNPLERLLEVQETLDALLSNWKRATVDCTYADVPRELLETKNKELLLEKASTFALFDKSVSVESCKTTNRIVRDYLGITGKGPLVGVDKVLRKGLDALMDPDDLDEYVIELEKFSQAYSRASSLSYAAGVADFDSVNNFGKEEVTDEGKVSTTSNLEQSRLAIIDAKSSIDKIVIMLQKEG